MKSFKENINELKDILINLDKINFDVKNLNSTQIKLIGDFKNSDELQSYIDEIKSITNADYGDFGTLRIQEYAVAIQGLEAKQAALLLSTQGLTNAQIAETLAINESNIAKNYQAMADAGLLARKKKLTVAEIQENLQTVLGTKADASATMTSLGLSGAIEGQEQQTVQLTTTKLQDLVITHKLTEAQAQELAMRTGMMMSMQAQNTTIMPTWIANIKAMAVATLKQAKATIVWLATNPAGWIAGAVAGIAVLTAGIWKLHDALTVTLEEQKEKLKEAKESWETVKNELQEVETELQNNIDKIKELEALSNPSWVDKEELNRLREVNKELKLQKQLRQDEQLKAAEDLYQENKKTFDKEFISSYTGESASIDATKQRFYSDNFQRFDLIDQNNLVDIEAALQYLNETRDEQLIDADESKIQAYEQLVNNLIESKKRVIQTKGNEYLSSLSEYKQNILDIASVRDLTEDEQATYDYLASMQRMIYEFYSPATWNTLEFDSIFDTKDLEKTKEELIAMAKAGELSPEALKSYPKLNNAIKESAIIAGEGSDAFREFYNQVMALANPDALNYDEVRRQLFNASGIRDGKINGASDAKIYQKLESAGVLSHEGLEAYIAVRAKYDISEFNVDELIYYIQQELNDKSSDVDVLVFDDIFAFKNADGALTDLGKISESIDTIQKAYNTLSSAIDEYDNNGVISVDTLQSVMELGDDWLDYLVAEDGALKLDKESLDDLAKSRLEEMRVRTLNNLVNQVKQIENDAQANDYLKSTNYDASKSFEELARTSAIATAELLKAKVASGDLSQGSYDAVIEKMYSDINKINTLFDNASTDLSYKASSAAQSFTDLLDKELAVLDKKLEAGYIDFNDYIQARLTLIEDYYSQGKIKSDEYYSYLENHYKQELSYRDKVIKAVTRRIDKEIDNLEKQKDAIKENYQLQIDALENQKTLLEDVNKERQRQIDLQKALYELERAKNQRTKLVYSEGGMHYVADDTAIRDAENEAENARQEIQISEIEKSISELEQARDAETDAIDDMIDKLQEYKEAWNDITSAYEESQEDLLAAQFFGQEWEEDIINCRTDVLENFKDDYIAIQQAMADAAWQSANEQIRAAQEAAKGADGVMSGARKIGATEYKVVYEGADPTFDQEFRSLSEAQDYAERMNEGVPDDEPSYYIIKKYHTGLKQGLVDTHSFDDDFKLVQKVGLGEKELPAILKEGEAVATPAQISNIADGLRTADGIHSAQAERPYFAVEQERLAQCAALLGRSIDDMVSPMNLLPYHMSEMTNMDKLNHVNTINNIRQNQPITMSNHINVTCPGVTEQQVAERLGSVIGKELDRQFSGFHMYADQMSRIR